jgi:hypothetical protein
MFNYSICSSQFLFAATPASPVTVNRGYLAMEQYEEKDMF